MRWKSQTICLNEETFKNALRVRMAAVSRTDLPRESEVRDYGATNRPHELDDAVLRRFPKRIMLGLPDESARAVLISQTLKRHQADSGLNERDIRWIASNSDGYSNSDLVALCKEAAMVPVRAISREKLASAGTRVRSLKVSDFSEALKVIRPSTNDRVLDEMKHFASRAGQSV